MRLCYGLVIEAPILSKACIPIRRYEIEARSSEYTPAQEQRGLILSTACPLPAPLDPIPSFHNGIINGLPQSARPLVQFREGGRCRAIGLQWRSENLIQHFRFSTTNNELDFGGAYDCFLTLVALALGGHVFASLQAQLGRGRVESSVNGQRSTPRAK